MLMDDFVDSMYRYATLLALCVAQVHWCIWLMLSGLCGVAYLWVDLCRKNACSRCCKDTHRICTCEIETMNTDNFSGSSLNSRASTLPGINCFCHPAAFDETK